MVPLVVLDPGLLARSPNRARFYLECLVDLDQALSSLGGRLIVRRGDVTDAALRVAREARCGAIFLTADVGPFATRRVDRLSLECVSAGIELRTFPGMRCSSPALSRRWGGRATGCSAPTLVLGLRPIGVLWREPRVGCDSRGVSPLGPGRSRVTSQLPTAIARGRAAGGPG